MKKALGMLAAAGVIITLYSCTNERIFFKGNVVCTATNRYTNDWRYFRIELGTPSRPYVGAPALRIRSPNKIEFQSDEISVSEVLSRNGIKKMPFCTPTSASPPFDSWPPNTQEYHDGSISFAVTSNSVIQIMLVHEGEFQVVGQDRWYSLPCSEKDIRDAFGNAERVYEWWRE